MDASDLAALRGGLLAFCYQMLGSPFDAEDAVQDALERAWRSRASYDPDKAGLSTWVYRIARNVCVDRLRETPRRPLPRDLTDPGIDVGAPLMPALDVPWLVPAPTRWWADSEPERAVAQSSGVRLAVTLVLQALPPKQRGVFILREVLGHSAAETAEILETSVPSVNSALQRAKAAVAERASRPAPLRRETVNSRRIEADPVAWARETSTERDVIVIGSGSLVESFVAAEAVDEYRLRVFPTATGAGRRLFPDGAALDLVSVEQMGPTSLVIATPSAPRGR